MYNFLVRRGTTIAFVVGFLISALIIFLTVSGASGINSDDYATLYGVEQFVTSVGIGTFLVIVSVVVILLGGIYGLIINPKGALKFVIGAGVLLILMLALYFGMSDNNTIEVRDLVEQYDIQGAISKMITVGIFSTLILLGVAFFTVLLAEIRNAFK